MKCPICNQPTVKEKAPFCSELCQKRDLLNWFDESYKVPAQAPLDEEHLIEEEDEEKQ